MEVATYIKTQKSGDAMSRLSRDCYRRKMFAKRNRHLPDGHPSKNGKENTVNYYLVQNAISKDIHAMFCKESKTVKAKGMIKDVNGKDRVYRLADKTVEGKII